MHIPLYLLLAGGFLAVVILFYVDFIKTVSANKNDISEIDNLVAKGKLTVEDTAANVQKTAGAVVDAAKAHVDATLAHVEATAAQVISVDVAQKVNAQANLAYADADKIASTVAEFIVPVAPVVLSVDHTLVPDGRPAIDASVKG